MRYDSTSIPSKYRQSRALSREDQRRWLKLIREFIQPDAGAPLLDLGCGTGRFTSLLSKSAGAAVIGLDPSRKMLLEAVENQPNEGVAFVQGCAEHIPLSTGMVNSVFVSNALHHFEDLGVVLAETARILGCKGTVFVRNYSRENLDRLLYLRHFPEAVELSCDLLKSRDDYVRAFADKGFLPRSSGTLSQQAAPNFDAYIAKIESRVYSDLALISDASFCRGKESMKAFRSSAGTGPVLEDVDYFVFQKC